MAYMGKTTTSYQQPVLECPACQQTVHATVTAELELKLGDVASAGQVEGSGRVTGMRLQHDCTPKVTR